MLISVTIKNFGFNPVIFFENLKINNLENLVNINHLAISDINGILKFSIGLDGENHILTQSNHSFINVESVTLDYYCTSKNINCIDYLKVDVEGFELTVIKGARNLLSLKKIKIIQLEINKTISNSNSTIYELIDTLNGFGYFLCKYDVEIKKLIPILFSDMRENYFLVYDINISDN